MLNSKKKVANCSNTNLREVWVALEGGPSSAKNKQTLDKHIGTFAENLKDNFFTSFGIEHSIQKPFFIGIPQNIDKQYLPFWNQEFIWTNSNIRKNLRIGNNFLALHSSHSLKFPYRGYSADIKSVLKKILQTTLLAKQFNVQRILFNYTNIFEFNSSVSLKDYFEIGHGLKINEQSVPLSSFETQYQFKNSTNDKDIVIKFHVQPISKQKVRLIVQTIAIQNLDMPILCGKLLTSGDKIEPVKQEAKSSFFGCATQKTKTELGVKYEL